MEMSIFCYTVYDVVAVCFNPKKAHLAEICTGAEKSLSFTDQEVRLSSNQHSLAIIMKQIIKLVLARQ